MMTIISIGKDSHLIPIIEIALTYDTQWKNIQYFDLLSVIFCSQLGLNSVVDLVTSMSNIIPTEIAESYKDSRKVSIFVEGSSKKAEYIDGIRFF